MSVSFLPPCKEAVFGSFKPKDTLFFLIPSNTTFGHTSIVIKREYYPKPTDLSELTAACDDIFSTRNKLASKLPARPWPPRLTDNPHWRTDYRAYAEEVDLDLSLADAIEELNDWITMIAK